MTNSHSNNGNRLVVPPRGPWEALAALGVQRTDEGNAHAVQVEAPAGWTIQPTEVSPFHHHLVDAGGTAIACLLTKPGSGGTGSFQMTTRHNCACKHEPATTGLVRTAESGTDHQMQLWIRGSQSGYYFEIRQNYQPNGKLVRSCVLDTGKAQAERSAAVDAGNAAMDLLLKK